MKKLTDEDVKLKIENRKLRAGLLVALKAMRKGAVADDDVPTGQHCDYCTQRVDWPAVQAGFGGHMKDCAYSIVRSLCEKLGIKDKKTSGKR